MAEGRYWSCRWIREDSRYRVWVAKRPSITGAGRDWQAALDALCESICMATGDGEPNLSFDPPEPVEGGDAEHAHPDWLVVSAEGSVPVDTARVELFERGYCKTCNSPQGSRTQVPLVATGPAEGDLCWPEFISLPYLPVLCSDRFLETLTDDERQTFDWLPVTPAPRSRKRYFECVPRSIVAPVAVRGWTVSGAACPECRAVSSVLCTSASEVNFSGAQIHKWVAGDDLPRPAEGIVAFGDRRCWLPLFPTDRARALARQNRGARTGAVGLAPAGRVVRRPKLPLVPKRPTKNSR